MIDHVLGRPSAKLRRLQVLGVLAVWSTYLWRGNKNGPPGFRRLSRWLSKYLTPYQTAMITVLFLYGCRNCSTLIGLASPEPLANMYEANFFRATWFLTAMDAGFWTAMKISNKRLRDLAGMVFTIFYLFQTSKADEKVRKIRSNLTIEHLRVSWNKGTTPYLSFFNGLMRPRFTRWTPRQIRIPRPETSDYKEYVSGWLYYDGPLHDIKHHNKIVLDIPGGGFVAMDPRCNDDRLLCWSAKTGLPILSLDYKKAPEYPYPYALNECYDVYTTIVQSKGRCVGMPGTEVPHVIICGDSAGGSLAASTTLMIIESGATPTRRFQGREELPLPDAVVLFYPGLDMNIGNWMSDEQMSLMKDRRLRTVNRRVVRRKSMQYDNLVGTPHHSDDDDDAQVQQSQQGQPLLLEEPPVQSPDQQPKERRGDEDVKKEAQAQPSQQLQQHLRVQLPPLTSMGAGDQWTVDSGVSERARSAHPEYAHPAPSSWSKSPSTAPSSEVNRRSNGVSNKDGKGKKPSASHHSEPLRTRLATSSMISYFNDRILTPEMMRAMIILYIGPHNRPDFSTDYLLSPVLAPDMLLARFPKTYFLTGERDPLVDDTVIFAGRLRRVKAAVHASGGTRFEYRDDDGASPGFEPKDVAETVLIPGISHGFMQFPSLYPPAWKWIERSAGWIVEAFEAAENRGRERRRRGASRRAEQAAPALDDEATNHADEAEETGVNTVTNGDMDEENQGARDRFHSESSGDEDHGLEMSMVRPKGKGTALNGAGAASAESSKATNGGSPHAVEAGDATTNGNGKAAAGRRNSGNGVGPSSNGNGNGTSSNNASNTPRSRKKSSAGYKDANLHRLASSDDLLGRRMQGLAGGLTGLIEED